jgi:ABC-2 type transport system ATP-binding protein
MSTVISVSGLQKSYGANHAVDGVSLEIQQGEIFALLGPNGAGKTTTVEILEGFRKRDGGEVSVLGIDPATQGGAAQMWRDRLGIVLQSTLDAGDLTVLESVSHFARYYTKPKNPREVLDLVGLLDKADSLGRTLSGGQRRRLDVALGIIGSPEVIFLDEPTTGFDPEARRAFWGLIRNLRDEGATILLTTHYLDEAEALADRVAVINHGKIIEVSTPATLGGRATAMATVSWREGDFLKTHETDTPTHFISELASRFNGEVPELNVKRPSLEDIYLHMIGSEHE